MTVSSGSIASLWIAVDERDGYRLILVSCALTRAGILSLLQGGSVGNCLVVIVQRSRYQSRCSLTCRTSGVSRREYGAHLHTIVVSLKIKGCVSDKLTVYKVLELLYNILSFLQRFDRCRRNCDFQRVLRTARQFVFASSHKAEMFAVCLLV